MWENDVVDVWVMLELVATIDNVPAERILNPVKLATPDAVFIVVVPKKLPDGLRDKEIE